MQNVRFNYLYRDSGNYKIFGYVIFSNTLSLSLSYIDKEIRTKLIDDTWFYAEQWGLPTLLDQQISIQDPSWHEFESVAITTEIGENDISSFLNKL
ncbi:hypothetical protein INP83_01915 [Mucilaginibacter sp. 21P]|uniref:hypothetical protein n=1 Tax=Mucilaginibacter sp. 21P TaxID=2778902 RepID=UPI001C59D378|nr:hypothetical protein [Mucilaginibacter sp. 21P]QXV65874.1 hypothetical protein INP83_01915 [Mucilaginibacter sp. 21P]